LFSVFSASLAVTEEIPVGFYFCAALTNMLKFSAYPRLSQVEGNFDHHCNPPVYDSRCKQVASICNRLDYGESRHHRVLAELDFDDVDRADEDTFNRILWHAVKGSGVPYPGKN
jgi:hypothetical protein